MWWIAAGCMCGRPSPELPPEREAEVDARPGLHLAESVPFAALSIPDDSRDGAPAATEAVLDGGWIKRKTGPHGTDWSRPTPFRPRGMFFTKAQPGMNLRRRNGVKVPYRGKGARGGLSWRHDAQDLIVHTPEDEAPPSLTFDYDRAAERERHLHFVDAKADGAADDEVDFVRGATVQEGWTSRQGLLLPAPARASWKLDIPENAVLTMEPGLVRPELAALEPSDGCELVVEIGGEQIFAHTYLPGQFSEERIDLSKWAGEQTLTMVTKPGASARYDFCFVGGPVISPKKERPRRVILVFVDTLRPDHLSLYGYGRSTTPNLDRIASGAAVFSQARSIAPWTLPSARTLVTGFQPEHYGRVNTLQGRLGEAGFITGMIAGNVYLSANFDMERDWDHHEVGMFPPANQVTDDALAWLARHEGTDSFLQVHYMSAHLPYLEPPEFRRSFAGTGPPGLGGQFHLAKVRKAKLDTAGKQYVEDRYDNCIQWIDHELLRLYEGLQPEDILVFTSDHGEEFWEHGGYEHGHTLYDELLRVPLVIKGPGMKPGRFDTPVSLLDVTPTVLDMLGMPAQTQGVSLLAHAGGDDSLTADRVHAFGRPLYGQERWGVLDKGMKWTTRAGSEQIYALRSDPHEKSDVIGTQDPAPFRAALGETLKTRADVAYRFVPSRNASLHDALEIEVRVPGGVDHAWFGADALQRSKGSVEHVSEEVVRFTWHRGFRGTREAYVMPKGAVVDTTRALGLRLRRGIEPWRDAPMPSTAPRTPQEGGPLLHDLDLEDGRVQITWAMGPAVDVEWMSLDATDGETAGWLKELGYVERDE